MKALIHLDQNGKKVMERRVHDAVMKERADISTRAQYVWALSMLQCGLPPRTVQRVSDHFEAVLDKYMEYQTEDLGDLFMRSIAMALFMQMAASTTSSLYAMPPLQNQTWLSAMIAPQRSALGITRIRILSAMTHVATAMVCCPLP